MRNEKKQECKEMPLSCVIKPVLYLQFILFLALILVTEVSAVSIGVSPGIVNAEHVMRGGYYERMISITLSSEDEIGISGTILDSEIKDWLKISAANFTVSKSKPYQLKLIITPPSDAANGNYTGYIRFVTTHLGSVSGNMGSAVRAAVDLKVNVGITDVQIIKCRAMNILVDNTEVGSDSAISFTVINDGNVRFRPSVDVFIWDQNLNNVVKFFNAQADEAIPTQENKMFVKLPIKDLSLGQYWGEIAIKECRANSTSTFDVLEKGSLASQGVLINIVNKIWVDIAENVPLTAIFRNTGNNSVLAKFVGEVELDGTVITTLKSDEYEVGSGQDMNFTVYFKPEKEGRYTAKGYIVYNKKRTDEKFGVINVAGEEASGNPDSGFSALFYLVPLVIIILILIKIKKKKMMSGKHR